MGRQLVPGHRINSSDSAKSGGLLLKLRLVPTIALLSWFLGGILLGLIEVIILPSDPIYSTLLQLSPLLFLVGGIWLIFSNYQKLSRGYDKNSRRLRRIMGIGWFAIFGVDAGVASLNNMATEIFNVQLPYYYQGVSLAQRVITLMGILTLGTAASLSLAKHDQPSNRLPMQQSPDFWEEPVTNIGFISLLLGVILGLAQYWSMIVFAGLILLLAGAMFYPIGVLTEKELAMTEAQADLKT